MSEITDTRQNVNVALAVENFGPIAEARIDLRPLTVFVGPSNTGKTYFATLVYALHGIFDEKLEEKTLQCDACAYHNAIASIFKRCFDVDSVEELIRFPNRDSDCLRISLKSGEANQKEATFISQVRGAETTFQSELRYSIGQQQNSEQCYYLPATRSGIIQNYRIIASSAIGETIRSDSSDMPTLSSVIVDFMQHLTLYTENRKPSAEISTIADALETEVLAGKIIAKPSASGYPEFFYRPRGTKVDMQLNQAAAMVSELAPLVLFLRGLVHPGDTLIIEEPEAHLHPRAQADMAVILARLVRAGAKVIVTTHSDWLLEEIGNLILEGLITEKGDEPMSWLLPEEVSAWHFQKNEPVKEITFDNREGISPKDFEDVAEGLYNRSVNLQQRFEKQKVGNTRDFE